MPNPTHTPGELKACPFCGGEADCIHKPMEGTYSIECHDCLAQMPYVGLTSEEAITAWNHRTVDTELLEALNALDRSWLETFPDGPDGDYGLVSIGDEHKALWQQARAAITKATGHG